MSKNKQINHKGFTLLELLLVIGMVAILSGIVILALNPGRSLAKTRDLQRTVGISEINKALAQYYIDHGSYPPTLSLNIKSICNTGASATSTGFGCTVDTVDLSMLVPTYLPAIPVDPTGVGYQAGISSSRYIMLVANLTEVSPIAIAIGTTTVPFANDTSLVITVGSGTINDPYQISNWHQLNHIRDNGYIDQNFILVNDLSSITAGYSGLGDNWVPIGDDIRSFIGNFNGGGFTISDLIINRPTEDFVGLFGALAYVSVNPSFRNVYNLTLRNVDITGRGYVGALVGYNEGGHIKNCSSQGTVRGVSEVGGLVGRNFQGIISSSFSSADIVGRYYLGVSTFLGGLVGNNNGNLGYLSNILNSYSTGSVTAYNSSKEKIGGFSNNENAYSIISNSYSTGLVSFNGSTNVGGFVGYNGTSTSAGIVNSSYWNKTTSGQESSAGGTGTTTAGMKDPVTYVGWDSGIWKIDSGSYPTLK
jgi:prepilin-type N-terminal cleavage/methylation domain-containing protein